MAGERGAQREINGAAKETRGGEGPGREVEVETEEDKEMKEEDLKIVQAVKIVE